MVFWWIVGILAVGTMGYYWVMPAVMAISFVAAWAWVTTLFVVGAPLFWVLMIASFGLMLSAVEMASWLDESSYDHYDYYGNMMAFWTMAGTFLLLQLMGDIKIFSYLFSAQWYIFLAYFIGYFILGAIVSLPKLDVYTKKVVRPAYDNHRDSFLKRNMIADGVMPDSLKDKWNESLPRHLHLDVKHHKNRLICWMIVWPVTLFWLLFRDVLLDLWNHVYDMLSTVYQRIFMRHFKDVASDFVKTPPPAPPADNVGTDVKLEAETVTARRGPSTY